MLIKYFLISGLFTSIILLISCDVINPENNEYSQSIIENGITFSVKNGSLNTPGEIRILNNSSQSVFILNTLYPSCNFSNYSLMKASATGLLPMTFDEFNNIWIVIHSTDSIFAVCDMYKSPIEIKPFEIYSQNISKVLETGLYKLTMRYRFSEFYNLNIPDGKISLDYIVD
jgi:hypothetical protein